MTLAANQANYTARLWDQKMAREAAAEERWERTHYAPNHQPCPACTLKRGTSDRTNTPHHQDLP